MIRYGRYADSPECYYLIYLDPESHFREVRIHVHISEIRRFFGHRPNDTVIYNSTQLTEFFTFKNEIQGASGNFRQTQARKKARIPNARRVGKPNSPGEGVE